MTKRTPRDQTWKTDWRRSSVRPRSKPKRVGLLTRTSPPVLPPVSGSDDPSSDNSPDPAVIWLRPAARLRRTRANAKIHDIKWRYKRLWTGSTSIWTKSSRNYTCGPLLTGLGKFAFEEARYDVDGNENSDFILNQDPYRKAQIIVAGDNFGCGSSREHAPWALTDFGIRCVISTSFGDIFFNNSMKNGRCRSA